MLGDVTNENQVGINCSSQSSDTLTIGLGTPDAKKYTAHAWNEVQNESTPALVLQANFDYDWQQYLYTGVFITMLFVLTLVFIFSGNPQLAIGIAAGALILAYQLEFFFVPLPVLISVAILAIITIYRMDIRKE